MLEEPGLLGIELVGGAGVGDLDDLDLRIGNRRQNVFGRSDKNVPACKFFLPRLAGSALRVRSRRWLRFCGAAAAITCGSGPFAPAVLAFGFGLAATCPGLAGPQAPDEAARAAWHWLLRPLVSLLSSVGC